jgi:hypothetical protein
MLGKSPRRRTDVASPGRPVRTGETPRAADGTLAADAGRWIREQLTPNFEAVANGIAPELENDKAIRGLPITDRDAVSSLAAELKRELGIVIDTPGRRRSPSPSGFDEQSAGPR